MAENILVAKEGYIFTNGNAYGYTIELGCGDKAENWREITEEEYEEIMRVEEPEDI